jgi:hypothetical protein
VLEVKARISGQLSRDLLEPHRRFVLELAVQAVGHKKADRVLFLFNDLLLVTKPKKKSTTCDFVSDYFLNKLTVMDLPDAPGTKSDSRCPPTNILRIEKAHQVSLTEVGSSEPFLVFLAHSAKEKEGFVCEASKMQQEMEQMVRTQEEKSQKKPQLKTDDMKLLVSESARRFNSHLIAQANALPAPEKSDKGPASSPAGSAGGLAVASVPPAAPVEPISATSATGRYGPVV